MFNYIDLHFQKGEILTEVMLTELNQFPRQMFALPYENRKNAIVQGANIVKRQEEIVMEKGVALYQGELYRMEEECSLSAVVAEFFEGGEGALDTDYKLVLVSQQPENRDQRKGQVFQSLVPQVFLQSKDVEGICLLQFNTSSGALKIPVKGTISSIEDLKKVVKSTSFSVVNVPYSGGTGQTYHPYLFAKIKEFLVGKKEKTSIDYMVLHEIMKNRVLELEWMALMMSDLLNESKWMSAISSDDFDRKDFLLHFLPCLVLEPKKQVVYATSESIPERVVPKREGNMI